VLDSDDVYEDFKSVIEFSDFSDYPESHSCHDKANKKVIGKFKDEANGKIITEFIGLRPKLYSYIVGGDGQVHMKGKVSRSQP
jgi:hypothetical protein